MASSVIPRNFPMQLYTFADMADGLTAANLLTSLNANDSVIPVGTYAVLIGSSGNPNRCLILVVKGGPSSGRAITISPYVALNNLTLTYTSGTWTQAT